MPNHVTTVCTVSGPAADVDQFIAAHIVTQDGKRGFDLGTVILQPKCVVETESGSEADDGFFALTGLNPVHFAMFCETPMHRYAKRSENSFPLNKLSTVEHFREWLTRHHPTAIEKGARQLACFRETGHRDWYEWAIANWGTKWNSYDYEERFRGPGKFVFKFETAWSVPEPVFCRLAELYTTLSFDLIAVDEGGPQFVGHYADQERCLDGVPDDRERYRAAYGHYPDVDAEADHGA